MNTYNKLLPFCRNNGEIIILESNETLNFRPIHSYLFLILSGKLLIGKISNTHIITTLAFLQEEDCCYTPYHLKYSYQMQALNKTILIVLDNKSIQNLVKIVPESKYFLFFGLIKYQQKIEDINMILAPRTIKYRLIHLLLLLAKYFGNNSKLGIEISISISQLSLAKILGSSRSTIIRIFKILKKEKCIKKFNSQIIITNPIYLTTILKKNKL